MATEDQGIATEQLGIANEQDLLATATQNAANTQLPEISSAHWCRASRRRGRCSSATAAAVAPVMGAATSAVGNPNGIGGLY
jgi:hypothetical protein